MDNCPSGQMSNWLLSAWTIVRMDDCPLTEYLVMTILLAKIVYIETLGISVQKKTNSEAIFYVNNEDSDTEPEEEYDIFVICMWNKTFFYQFSCSN